MDDKIELLPTGTYHFDIIEIKERQSKSGRYGYVFKLKPIRKHEDKILFHSIWFGNYKNYQMDSRKKSTFIWKRAKNMTKAMSISMRDLLKNKKIKQSFIAEVIIRKDIHYGTYNQITNIIG